MTNDEIQNALYSAIRHIAPEADPAKLAPDADLREELDLDSMDFLNIVVELHGTLHLDIPERDYARLSTVRGAVDYLASRVS